MIGNLFCSHNFVSFLGSKASANSVLWYTKKLDMYKYFDFIMFYGKDNVYVRKPENAMFDYVIEKFNLNIKETLSIGDRTIDYIASKKSNLPVCLFKGFSATDVALFPFYFLVMYNFILI